jgi:hypothetical protein
VFVGVVFCPLLARLSDGSCIVVEDLEVVDQVLLFDTIAAEGVHIPSRPVLTPLMVSQRVF